MTAGVLSREEVARRILALPKERQGEAVHHAARLYAPAVHTGPRRDPDHRRTFAGDPARYIRDVLGYTLTEQQEEALQLIEACDRMLIPSGNNLGKTFELGAYGVYRFDAVAALPDLGRGLEEQGCQLLLPGPDHSTVFATLYSAMLEHAARADRRGYPMPGERSENSVLWRVRPRWQVEAFSPPARVTDDVAHTASGRHHRNQVALIEEGQGVPERVWRSTEGMCSGEGNKIISSFNPTEPRGSAYRRARNGSYRVYHMTAFRHPNVRQRANLIPDAVAFKVIDDRVRDDCLDRGPAPATTPDAAHHDFLYALPPQEAPERGPRSDGELGHPDVPLRVFRPNGMFTAQVMGRWPSISDTGLFDPASWDAAVERGRRRVLPSAPPDQVGVDAAREGNDDSCIAPRWGDDAETLLRAYAEAMKEGPRALLLLRATRRAYVGPLAILQKGDGPTVALQVTARYPASPYNVDEGGVGSSVVDHLARVLEMPAVGVSFSATPPPQTPGEPLSENMRTAMYVRAARLVAFGLVDAPDDSLLREEVLAHTLEPRARTVQVDVGGGVLRKIRKPSVLLVDKDKVKKALGRSPDRSDAFVLGVNGSGLPKPHKWELY